MSVSDEIRAIEGDPNGDPRRNRPGGPEVEWVRASDLQASDRVMLSNKFIYTVEESAAMEANLWKLRLGSPEVAPTSERTRPERLGPTFPKVRDYLLNRNLPYRRLTA